MDSAPTRVLLVEDSRMDSRLISLYLGESSILHFAITPVERLKDALERLSGERYDVILSDLSLPDSHGLETFRRLHAHAPTVAIVVLSGADDDTLAIQAVREGAQDYLVKGRFDSHLLTRAMSYAIERQCAELALQEREHRLQRLLDSITDYTYTVTLDQGRPAAVAHGPGCKAVTGYTPQDYEADRDLWYRMIHEEDRDRVVEQSRQVLAGTTPPPLEHRIRHRSGEVRWVRSTLVPRRDEKGRMTAYDGLVSDITERKQAENQLIKSEAFYHSLVEHLPQNIFRKDLDERFTFANQRFCQLLGQPLDHIIGKTDFDFYPPELAAKYQRDDREVIRTGRSLETIEENISSTGEKIYVQVVKTLVFDAHGRKLGTQCIFWDITERRRFEEQLRKSEAALRRTNEALKAAQQQLIHAEKMESVGTLAAGVAHEIKNPLAILEMGVNFLTRKVGGHDDNIATVLKEMHEAIARADSISRSLLDYAAEHRLSAGLEDFNDLVEGALRLVRHEIAAKSIRLDKDLAPGLPLVNVERNRIQQVLVNVLMNALQAMSERGTLTVRTRARQITQTTHSEGSRHAAGLWIGDTAVVAEIDDTGPGIPPEYMSRIYDPFFTTKPAGEGTGLGLSVSRRIIELHGGLLEVHNLPECGVRVTILLKAHKEKDQHDAKETHTSR
ncbi:MAG: PAS domain S-box protein [Verrucomicrobia bacterium]|nr:PAS domain S-box protein [Verrucomicrobiota bacterium]